MRLKIESLTAFALATAAITASLAGCELIATVDRSQIPGSGGAGGTSGTGGTAASSTAVSSSTGVAGTGGMPSTSSTGGTCGATACSAATDCPDPGTECILRQCTGGCCSTSFAAAGSKTPHGQVPYDCHAIECNGVGVSANVVDTTDTPLPIDGCYVGGCDMTGNPTQTLAAPGTSCGFNDGQVCDGFGNCIGCNSDADCTAPAICDPFGSETCVAPSCSDGLQDGTETAVDCGGTGPTGCPPCPDGDACLVNSDCQNGLCDATQTPHACADASCSDTLLDGSETDVDCGGGSLNGNPACPACANGKHCAANSDCQGGLCDATHTPPVCAAASCSDTVLDGNETDVDCGGGSFNGIPACPACANGKHCAANSDCQNGLCDLSQTPPVCAVATCNDGLVDGAETDLDCGGGSLGGNPACPPCMVGQACNVGSDCATGLCSGGQCAPKANGSACGTDAECASGTCGTAGTGNCCAAACSPVGGTCGATGCDNAGACIFPASGTPCGSGTASCTDGATTSSQTAATACDGAGSCAGATTSCGAYRCTAGGTTCLASCTTDANCVPSSYCNAGMCSPVSCSMVHAGSPALGDGTYTVDPDGSGPIAPFQVYCDMTNDGGGWTLIQSHVAGQATSSTPATSVALGSGTFLDPSLVQALAAASTGVRITDNGSNTVVSADSYPITRLAALQILDDDSVQDSTHWTGTGAAHMAHSCSTSSSPGYPAIYWACNNGDGLHVLPGNPIDFSTHGFDNDSTSLDVFVQ